MNALGASEYITIDDLTVWFTDPQSYTLIQITTEPFSKLALAGGIVIMLGLLLALYVQPAEMWARKKDGLWLVTGSSRKGGVLFDRALREKLEKAGIRAGEKDDKKPPKESSEGEKSGEAGERAEEDEKHGESGEKSEEDEKHGKSGEKYEEDEKSGEPGERAEPDEKAEVSGELSGKDLSEAEAAALEAMKLADEAAEAYRAAEERAKKAALAYKEARERAAEKSDKEEQ
jgi:cytochrome c biogenesis protein ResB